MLHKTLSSLSWLFRIWWNLWIKWYVQFIFFTFTHAYTGLLNSRFMILDNTEKHQMHCWYFSLRLVRHIISVGTQEPFLIINWFALHFMHLADKSHLQCIQAIYIYIYIYIYIVSMCVPWELNPWPFALLTQCSTTEPQEQEQEHWAWYSWCFISSFWASACFCIADIRNTNMYCFLWQIYSAVAEGMMLYLSFEFEVWIEKEFKMNSDSWTNEPILLNQVHDSTSYLFISESLLYSPPV